MADRIIKCAAALVGASYHDAPPSAELRDIWREMAADARQEADEFRAEVELLKSPAVVLAAAEKLLRERGVSVVKIIAQGGVQVWGGDKKTSRHSLAAAVARLEKERV